jgi:hypothetical protein
MKATKTPFGLAIIYSLLTVVYVIIMLPIACARRMR